MKNKILLIFCACFLFYKYIAQLFPALIGTDLMISRGYTPVMLAILASSYYYSYSIMQIFSGIIVDRYFIKYPMVLAIAVIAVMLFIFPHINNFYYLCLSRVLMGVGASFATIIYIKCAACYTNAKTFTLVSSFLATATMLGAAFGSAPVAFMFDHMGWPSGLTLMGVVGLAMSLLVFIFYKKDIKNQPQKNVMTKAHIQHVVFKRDNWLLLLYSGLAFSPVVVFGGLWGVPFLTAKLSISAVQASYFLSIMFVGLAVGAPIWAFLSTKYFQKTKLMHFANIISIFSLIGIIYCGFTYATTLFLFFLFGFSVGCFMLSFQMCREINSVHLMGLAVAFMNSGEGLMGSVLEPFIGYVLGLFSSSPIYSLAHYQKALFILPCCFVLSSIALFYVGRKPVVSYSKKYNSSSELHDMRVLLND